MNLLPHTVIRQARIVPLGPGTAAPSAPLDLRVEGGRITDVGEGLPTGGADTVVDAAGRWAIPGLWDHHVHMLQWAAFLGRLDTSGTSGPHDVVERVRRRVAELPPDDRSVITGWGHRSAAWSEQPTVAMLDAVAGEHPIVLISGDGHNGWLSSRALQHLGVNGVTGALDENDWFPLYSRLKEIPGAEPSAEEVYPEAVAQASARGIVGIGDMEFDRGVEDWRQRFTAGVTTLRARVAVYAAGLDDVLATGLRSGQDLLDGLIAGGSAGLVTMGPLKIISDGSLNTRTAYCCEPYADAADYPYPRGEQNNTPEELRELLSRARDGGLTAAVHAIGDAAISDALDAFAATGIVGCIEHAQLMAVSDIPRMAAMGVAASVQPAHLLDDRDVTMQCWPDRSQRCFAFRSMLDAGVELRLGSDAPVSPLDPWLAIAAAVHRSADEREPWHPEQAITAAEALAGSVDGQGTLGVGSRGDIVLLDEDPLGGPAEDGAAHAAYLRSMPVAATLLAGRVAHLAL